MSLRAWRIVQAHRAATAFDGEGACLAGGRWNRPGTPAVYAASTKSLAILEILVHTGMAPFRANYVALSVTIPPSCVKRVEISALPPHWRDYPAPAETMDLGTAWAEAGESAVLQAPSAVVPDEWNFVLNPRHPAFGKLSFGPPEPVDLDPRLRA